jgi:hypothetical protein
MTIAFTVAAATTTMALTIPAATDELKAADESRGQSMGAKGRSFEAAAGVRVEG